MTATIEVSTHALYVRAGPGPGYGIAGSLSQGQQAVADIAALVYGTWVKVLSPFVGYVYAGDSATKAYVKLLSIVIQPPPTTDAFQVKATTNLNVRAVPTTAGNTPLFYVKAGTLLTVESLTNGWYKLAGVQQYVSAQYAVRVDATPVPPVVTPPPPVQTGRVWGINTDPRNPTANPSAATLAGCGWVRFVFHVDAGTLDQAFAFYDPIIRSISNAGTKVMLILLQDTYWGNGPWSNGNWPAFYPGFADVAGKIAQHYKGQVAAYEIWNEMDLSGQPTSIYIPPENYARLILATTKAIRAVDLTAKVISGGLAGNDPIAYMTAVGVACGGLLPCDGIGYHPYGQTPPNTTVFDWQKNTLSPAIQRLHNAFKLPIWITEIGVPRIDVNNQTYWPVISTYMRNTFALVRSLSKAVCPVLIWFAWSDSQDSAGIVHNDQSHKGAIWDAFAANVKADTANPNDPPLPSPEPTPPPVVVEPQSYPLATKYRIGVHIQECYADRLQDGTLIADALLDMYTQANLSGRRLWTRVIQDVDMANKMAKVANVIYRMVLSQHEYYADHPFNTEAGAIAAANAMYDGIHKGYHDQVDPRCWLQFVNEAEYRPFDWVFNIQLAKRCKADGRRLAGFGDATANRTRTEWIARNPALDCFMQSDGQAIVVVNGYGEMHYEGGQLKTSDHLVSTPAEYPWFGNWMQDRYAVTSSKPYVVYAESQTSDSVYRGAERLEIDMKACQVLDNNYPWLLARLWYTAGRSWGHAEYQINDAIRSVSQMIAAL